MHITIQITDNDGALTATEQAVLRALAGAESAGATVTVAQPAPTPDAPAAKKAAAPAKKATAKKTAAPAPDPEPEAGSDAAAFEDLQGKAVEKASEVLHTGADGRAFVLERLAEAGAKKVSEIEGMERLQAFYDAVTGYDA
jgi:hypothetical protein